MFVTSILLLTQDTAEEDSGFAFPFCFYQVTRGGRGMWYIYLYYHICKGLRRENEGVKRVNPWMGN